MAEMYFHPIALLLPEMSEDRFAELVQSIRANGLREQIVTFEGQILDGRHRYRACVEAGVEPRFREFTEGNPYEFVRDLNVARRDLAEGQRAAVCLRLDKGSASWCEREQKRETTANKRRSEAAKDQARDDAGHFESGGLSGDKPPEKDHAHRDLAKRADVSEATAARVLALESKRSDLLDQVADGKLGLAEAMRQAKRDEVAASVPLPSSTYRVIYADPPWRYNDTRAGLPGYSATAAEDHYPTMSVAELSALDIKSIADPNAVLLCWATFPLLPDALEVVRSWGFKYKTAFVWAKGRANFGHYHTADAELLLIATRGSGLPDNDERERQVQAIERTGRHSQKPEEFRALIDRLWPHGRRVELFRRGQAPAGWDIWGNEAKEAT